MSRASFQERRRADFLQLVQFALLSVPGQTTDTGQLQHRLRLVATAQRVPPDQLPADLAAAAFEFVTAEALPLWASPTAATEIHWHPPDCDDDTRVPACAPVIDPVKYRNVQMTRKQAQVTCPECIQIGAAKARAGRL